MIKLLAYWLMTYWPSNVFKFKLHGSWNTQNFAYWNNSHLLGLGEISDCYTIFDPQGRPQSRPVVITIFTQSVRQSVRPSQNFKIKRQSLPAGNVGWPSWSLMTPVLCNFFAKMTSAWLFANFNEQKILVSLFQGQIKR